MRLFLSIEAKKAEEIGLSNILSEVTNELSFITAKSADLESLNNYGTGFRTIAIIPTCVDDNFWNAIGWKERVYARKGEADVRLRMDYERFVRETDQNKRLMFIDVIVKSIRKLKAKTTKDFDAEKLVADILSALNVKAEELAI